MKSVPEGCARWMHVSRYPTLCVVCVCVCAFKQMIKMGYFEPHTRLAVDRVLSVFFSRAADHQEDSIVCSLQMVYRISRRIELD